MQRDRHFSCTMCGKCCNRSPEVELTETINLSGDFVFWLCFSMSELPLSIKDWIQSRGRLDADQRDLAAFIAKRRLLDAQSSIQFTGRSSSGTEAERVRKYVRISALTLDLESGRCSKLVNKQCGIYDRRPHTCRTVPVHYQLSDLELEPAFDKFTSLEAFECDTSQHSPMILKNGRLAIEEFARERVAGQTAFYEDGAWREAIAQRILRGEDKTRMLPSLQEIKGSSCLKVLLVPIHLAWQIGVDIGAIDDTLYRLSAERQKLLIEALLRRGKTGLFSGIDVKPRRQLIELLATLTGHLESVKDQVDLG